MSGLEITSATECISESGDLRSAPLLARLSDSRSPPNLANTLVRCRRVLPSLLVRSYVPLPKAAHGIIRRLILLSPLPIQLKLRHPVVLLNIRPDGDAGASAHQRAITGSPSAVLKALKQRISRYLRRRGRYTPDGQFSLSCFAGVKLARFWQPRFQWLQCVERQEARTEAGAYARQAEFTFRTYCQQTGSYRTRLLGLTIG